ncbi:SpvB/TcaC N-terminal domain-containing protein, partial [Enterobacter ludwigii]
IRFTPPSLPSGGGSISGIKGEMGSAGPDGAAVFSVPLPTSPGRGFAPALALTYHSRAGNGPFGIGWQVTLPSVRRDTRDGVPHYTEGDTFIGPEGEVLVRVLNTDENHTPETRRATRLLGQDLGRTFQVHAYRSRSETDFSQLEYWMEEKPDTSPPGWEDETPRDFWVLYRPDGQVDLLGRHVQARLCSQSQPSHTAAWLLESSVSPTGEQIYYQYRPEDDINCDAGETAAHPAAYAQRYPVAAWYGNRMAGRTLPALGMANAGGKENWLFILVFDYAEQKAPLNTPPVWVQPGTEVWSCRQDSFSGYEYGFELRTRRLCQQILMFHCQSALSGESPEQDPLLVSQLWLSYMASQSVTTLVTVEQAAFEPEAGGKSGTRCALPPLTLGWQMFEPSAAVWQQRYDLGRLSAQMPYQMIDLRGEGIAGILYQEREAWWYREPVRDTASAADRNATTWGPSALLPSIPALREGGTLADLNGDGYPEWVITTPGTSGQYTHMAGGGWKNFTPLSALPPEYAHPRTQLTDLLSRGRADLVLIGPQSVRIYPGEDSGWKKALSITQGEGVILPVPDASPCTLVAFSDMAGSGQQHLVEVRAEGVRYWPNLGRGVFGKPITLHGFSQPAESFEPQRLFMADLDGSGTTDLIYALSDQVMIYLNQSGNRFAPPFAVKLPAGVRYGPTCDLQVADIQGLGMASLLLTVAHPVPRHYICQLSDQKPWLLNSINNNIGGLYTLSYRSSAQFWLDDKAAGKAGTCYLPLSLHLVQSICSEDAVSGNRLVSNIRYKHGVWDGREREFRGFGYVEVTDSDGTASRGTSGDISPPALTRSWYATGFPAVDSAFTKEYWSGDTAAYPALTSLFTHNAGEDETRYQPADDKTAFWLHRATKGILLRRERYGKDGTPQENTPYDVTEYRPQVRLVEQKGPYPVVWPLTAETRSWIYERVSSDPQCSQQIRRWSDVSGQPLCQISIRYPRRQKPARTPYPDSLPATLFESSYDEQQNKLRLTVEKTGWHTLRNKDDGVWMPGVASCSRSDVFIHPAAAVPVGGLSLEDTAALDGLSADNATNNALRSFIGQAQYWYLNAQGIPGTVPPAFPPRLCRTETALLDQTMVDELAKTFPPSALTDYLKRAGYQDVTYLFPRSDEQDKKIWTVYRHYTTFGPNTQFWLPLTYRETALTRAVEMERDKYHCVITTWCDAAGLKTRMLYDWRFLTPYQVTDINDNVHLVTLDALGRVTSQRFYGTENNQDTGYRNSGTTLPETVEAALGLEGVQTFHQCMVYVTDSWKAGSGGEKLPVHIMTLTTDRYDSDDRQQTRQQIVFFDGFGRELQTSQRHPDGQAWQRNEQGGLKKGDDGKPQEAMTTFRWAVSGRTEYDNKGQVIRRYQPYFLNHWKYVNDSSARQDLYADNHDYDPVGRERQVRTAKGWLRRRHYTPWFVVSEDENDTLKAVKRWLFNHYDAVNKGFPASDGTSLFTHPGEKPTTEEGRGPKGKTAVVVDRAMSRIFAQVAGSINPARTSFSLSFWYYCTDRSTRTPHIMTLSTEWNTEERRPVRPWFRCYQSANRMILFEVNKTAMTLTIEPGWQHFTLCFSSVLGNVKIYQNGKFSTDSKLPSPRPVLDYIAVAASVPNSTRQSGRLP